MRNTDVLWERIIRTKENVAYLDFILKIIRFANSNNKDVTKEWAIKAEEMLDDIDRKYEEIYKHFEELHHETLDKRNRQKEDRYN